MSDAVEMLGVSEATVRRLFLQMEEEGLAVRSHGTLRSLPSGTVYSFEASAQIYSREKQNIGRMAAMFVEDGDVVYLDCGTTVFQMTLALSQRISAGEFRSLNIVTNSIVNVQALTPTANCKLILVGGEYDSERRDFSGPLTERFLAPFHFNKCFLGCDGVNRRDGFSSKDVNISSLNACVMERSEDVCTGTSKANSAIIHAGFDAAHGTLMAAYNLKGCRMYPELAKELEFDYKNNGSLVLALSEEDIPRLEALKENGIKNGVEGLEIVGREKLKELEPSVGHVPVAALYAPSAGIVCPFGATVAFAENAYTNGVEFRFNTEVKGLTPAEDENGEKYWIVQTANGAVRTRTVINAAGVYADILHNLVSADKIPTHSSTLAYLEFC